MATAKKIDYVIAVPTFIGSLLSFLSSATAIVFHIARPPRRHFRHALILNLLAADMIYGLGNTISGAVFLANGHTPNPKSDPDTACLVSGWFSQSNAQAVDFNILIISITVLLSVVKKDLVSDLGTKWQILICLAAWVPGIITGTIGLVLDSYGYVSGNWCWVKRNRLDLRYGLSHGPRIAIFFATIIIYTYIYFTLKRVFQNLRSLSSTTLGTGHRTMQETQTEPSSDTQKILVAQTVSVEMHNMPQTPTTPHSNYGLDLKGAPKTKVSIGRMMGNDTSNDHDHNHNSTPFEASRIPAAPNVKKMLLMNGYPLAYIVLWIPGISNRLAESVGQSPRWLSALQCTTQYIGLINALTYGMSEQMRRGVWKKLKDTGRSRA